MVTLQRSFIDNQKYPYFHELFEKAIAKISKSSDRNTFSLWNNVNSSDIILLEKWIRKREDWLRRAAKILGVASAKELVKTFEVHPNNIAGKPGSFQDLMAEIYILLALPHFRFQNIKKIKRGNMDSPDFTAELNRQQFVIEVWHKEPSDEKEKSTRRRKGELLLENDLGKIDELLTQIVEQRTHDKFLRQFKCFPNHKSIVAIFCEWTVQSIFATEGSMNEIGKSLVAQMNDKIDYFLFMNPYENLIDFKNTFIFPPLE